MRSQERSVLVAAFERPAVRNAGRGSALLEQVLRLAAMRRTLRARVTPDYLPPTPGLLKRAIDRALDRRPEAVILLAGAGTDAAGEILLDRVALNRAPAEGGQPGTRLVSAGPDAYLAPAIIGPSLRILQRAGIPCRSSTDPRPTIANAGFYLTLHRFGGVGQEPPPVLLLRIPNGSPDLPLRRSARAVLLLVDYLAIRLAPTATKTPKRRVAPRVTARPKGGPQRL